MRRIISYLKPFWWIVILVIGMTFVQVQTELALPDYMSDIVTNGIQYRGITQDYPLVVTQNILDDALIFTDGETAELILNNYQSITQGTPVKVGDQLVTYSEDLYVLKEDHEALDGILVRPLLYVKTLNEEGFTADDYLQLQADPTFKVTTVKHLEDALKDKEDDFPLLINDYLFAEYQKVGLSQETLQTNYIMAVGLEMLAVSLIGVVAQITATYCATRVSAGVGRKLRSDVFNKVESFSANEFSQFAVSSLITRTTNDVQQVQMLVQMLLRMVLMAPMMGIVSIFKVLRFPSLVWTLGLAIVIISFIMIITMIIALPRFKQLQALVDHLNKVMQEFLEGILVIRAFNTETNESERFDAANKRLSKINLFVSRTMAITMPAMTFIMNALTILIIWFGAQQVNINAMGVGEIMAFIQYAMHVLMSFMIVAVIWIMIPRSLVSARRIFEVLDTPISITDSAEPYPFPNEVKTLAFDDVTFNYSHAEEAVLKNISFTADPGQTVAFIGSTGSGKSTLIKLIPRLFDVTEGKITYGEHDIREYAQKELRSHIGYIPQKATLFSGTIKENITFGRDVGENDIFEAIAISQSENIIAEKEEGLESPITQGGTNVSGGQRQRLSIARALAGHPDIYIFDDAFSALDYQTDKNLRAALKELTSKSKAIVLIVAQRIATIKDADKIIVLSQGEIVGQGKHKELLKTCEVYQKLCRSQLSQKELEYDAA